MGSPSITVISAHFGDPSWVKYSLNTLCQNSELVTHAIISDQKQIHADELDSYPALSFDAQVKLKFKNISVISVDPHQVNHSSLHHGQSLNLLIKLKIETSHVLILDSDCFPLDNKWEQQLIFDLQNFDVIVACDRQSNYLSHPCFMILPVKILPQLNFLEYSEDYWVDTGRLIGIRCLDIGLRVKMLYPQPSQLNFGDIYVPYNFFHVGSSSFRWRPEAHQLSMSIKDLKYDFRRFVAQSHPELLLENNISWYRRVKLRLRHFFAYLVNSKGRKPLLFLRIQRKLRFYKDSLFKN